MPITTLIRETFLRERYHWILWTPVCFAIGIGWYFTLATEPAYGIDIAVMLGSVLISWYGRSSLYIRLPAIMVMLIAAGFFIAHLRTSLIDPNMLTHPLGYVEMEATVSHIDYYPNRHYYILSHISIEDMLPQHVPHKIRLQVSKHTSGITPGMRVGLHAIISSPPKPVLPGAYDVGFRRYFEGIGAIGYAVSPLTILSSKTSHFSFSSKLSYLRSLLAKRILAQMEIPHGAIAVALMIGNKQHIPDAVMEQVRSSGLAHLLAISGMHLALVATLCFVGLRMLFALFPTIALCYPIKQWAAIGAMMGSFLYLCIAGLPISAKRAFIMTSIFLIAILVNRFNSPLRSVALAAFIVLILQPESLLSPSFQMSFSAVIALISAYEYGRRIHVSKAHEYWLYTFGKMIGAILLTSTIAGIATTPFAMYHFNHYAVYGAIANVVAIPLTSLWIMPWVVVAFLLMPIGLETLALIPMEWGIAGLLYVAKHISALPEATQHVPMIPISSLLWITFGGLWLCLWHTSWRLLGLIAIMIGAIVAYTTPLPTIIIDGEARAYILQTEDGYRLSSDTVGTYTRRYWQQRLGLHALPLIDTLDPAIHCDAIGCMYSHHQQSILFMHDPIGLAEACNPAKVDIIINLTFHRFYCYHSTITTLHRFDLWRNGTYMLWVEDRLRSTYVSKHQGNRPWVGRRSN